MLSPGWVGTTAVADIPVPDNVRRYYIPSTRHGGGRGGFSVTPANTPNCPGPDFGPGTFADNPVPHTETLNAIREHFRNWVMHDTLPPPSRYPTLADGTLTDPTRAAMGFPSIPGVPGDAPTGMVNPMLNYDWGATFNHVDGSGVPSNVPPVIRQVIKMKVPKVDADGNELGGVPVVLRDAPLGTYLGWNVVADGFHKGKLCNYAGGMIPFAETRAQRMASGDPRLSLEERYENHDGYVEAVKAAAAKRRGREVPVAGRRGCAYRGSGGERRAPAGPDNRVERRTVTLLPLDCFFSPLLRRAPLVGAALVTATLSRQFPPPRCHRRPTLPGGRVAPWRGAPRRDSPPVGTSISARNLPLPPRVVPISDVSHHGMHRHS